ncbi:hypothetical protein MK079_00890 [Candidatus Gracilibacteria bacterium]|nr:hypothetical protein [Candidatus Gracilibacteria bacterium]
MTLYIDIYGIQIEVYTQNTSLFSMIQKYYAPFLVDAIEKPDVYINLERYGYVSRKKHFVLDSDFATFGSAVQIDTNNKRYFFSQQEMSGTLDFSDPDIIKVHGKLIPNKIRHWVNIALQGFTRIDKYYNRFIIKTCIHDIVFILLEQKLSSCLLHATAVTNGEKTYLFTGLGGSGKSTLASSFLQKKGFTILSDNYGIVAGNKIFPFPELPRITKGTQKLLGMDLKNKADGTKNYLENNTDSLQKSYQIDGIFVCSYGKEFELSVIEDTAYIFELLSSINNYTKEFPEYLNLSLLSVIGKFNTNEQRIKNLKNIIDNNRFYLLKNNKDIDNTLNSILNV